MAGQVQDVVISLEQRLDTSAMPQPFTQVPISTEQVPVVTFLRQQARLRDELPLRTLQVCTTCKLEKVINPDFIQMKERSRRMKVLTGSFGAVIGAHHISPYVLVGKLVSIKNSDPDFVCQRCQGLDADETVITFCPQCGDRRTESVLRECPRCKLDYRTLLSPEKIWADIDVADPTSVEAQWAAPAVAGQWAPPAAAGQWAAPAAAGEWAPPAAAGQWAAPAAAGQWAAPAVAGQWTPPAAAEQWTPPATNPAGWFADYSGQHEYRYWDGQAWTAHVSDGGVATTDG